MDTKNANNFLVPNEKDKEAEQVMKIIRNNGLGPFFGLLDDELLLDFLEFCGAEELLTLSLVSHVFYIFTSHEELVSSMRFFLVLSKQTIIVENVVY